jgi:uncharacterized protein (DUF427 family)
MTNTKKPSPVQGTSKRHAIEDVAHYPRPPALEAAPYPITISMGGQTIVSTMGAYRALETYHPPTYYVPPEGVADGVLKPVSRNSICEWKGPANYFDVTVGGKTWPASAWCYPNPVARFAPIAGYLAFYCQPSDPQLGDRFLVDGVEAQPQPGNFYGGWVTPWTIGPIKGSPGTNHW